MSMDVADKFWFNADFKKLSDHWNYSRTIPTAAAKILPNLFDSKRIWDGACGDGSMVQLLRQRGGFDKIYASDLNPGFAKNVPEDVTFFQHHLADGLPQMVEDCDAVLLLGVICFLEDRDFFNLIASLQGRKVLIRNACDNDVYIKKYSEELGADYECYYRSAPSIFKALSPLYNTVKMSRIYPDELESKYGTKQRLFVAYN